MKPIDQLSADALAKIRAMQQWARTQPGAARKSANCSTPPLDVGMQITHPTLTKVQTVLESLSRSLRTNDRQGPRLVVLAGPTGTGKSHCLLALEAWMRRLTWEDVRTYWPGMPNVRRLSASAYIQLANQEPLRAEGVERCSLLLLDDVGAEFDRFRSGEPAERLRFLLEERRLAWTVLSTNIPPTAWAQTWDERVADRFLRRSVVIELWQVPSYTVLTFKARQRQESLDLALDPQP